MDYLLINGIKYGKGEWDFENKKHYLNDCNGNLTEVLSRPTNYCDGTCNNCENWYGCSWVKDCYNRKPEYISIISCNNCNTRLTTELFNNSNKGLLC